MKRLVFTIIAICCIVCAARAGSRYKKIHYTSYWSETQKSGLDMQIGSSPIAGMSQRAEGDFIINTDDSTFQITAPGNAPSVYKLVSIDEERNDTRAQYGETFLEIKDKDGTPYRVAIQRHYDLKYVKVYFFPRNSDTYRVYSCDYLKKLK